VSRSHAHLLYILIIDSYDLRESVNSTALETWGDEFEEAGITKAPSRLVRPPRVADSPVSFECRVHSIIRVANEHHGDAMAGPHLVGNSDIVIGRVIGIHVKGEYITGDGVSFPISNSALL
jgi:flavin reductase (DIM6/NTAB) family NADH-FMN oxidoreductase RutF